MQTLALVILIVLTLAMTILLAGGSLALLITDTIQGLMTYPIIFVFTIFILMNFSWWDEIVPVMSDRVAGESFINPYDIKSLRDFNLFAVIVMVLTSVLNRSVWFGGGASSAADGTAPRRIAVRTDFDARIGTVMAGKLPSRCKKNTNRGRKSPFTKGRSFPLQPPPFFKNFQAAVSFFGFVKKSREKGRMTLRPL